MVPRSESTPFPDHWSERRRDIHKLILEFGHRLTEEGYEVPDESEGIVVLSGPPQMADSGCIEKSEENVARIQYAVTLANETTANRAKKPLEELTAEDIDLYAPLLILDGETEQLVAMEEIAHETGYPHNKIRLINSGDRGISSTKTQFTELTKQAGYKNAKHLTFVSTGYHVPRAVRTAAANLPSSMSFDVVGIPFGQLEYDVVRKIRGEIRRILAYSEKGDIARFIKEPASPLTEFGNPPKSVVLHSEDTVVSLPREAMALYAQLEQVIRSRNARGELTPTNGRLANVDSVAVVDGKLVLQTSVTDYYSYLTASYYFRHDHRKNPIRPLAVSATLLGIDGTVIFERRINVTELEGKYHVFGGALKPGEQPKQAIANILSRKLGVEADSNAITIVGADQENLQNIIEVFFAVQLDTQQEAALRGMLGRPESGGTRNVRSVKIDKNLGELETLFHDTDLTDWNPSGFYNILYSLAASGTRSQAEILSIVDNLKQRLERKPFRYKYPIERLLKMGGDN